MTASLYDIPVERLSGGTTTLVDHQGKVLLIVNTASECGLTPQYEGLEALYRKYQSQGLVIAGFPCNQFGGQEPGTADQIGAFCTKNYGVTFPMYAKIDVNGENTHPLYAWLKKAAPGLLGSEAIKWNFTKFLVGRDGRVLDRYAPTTAPDALAGDIEQALAE